MQNPNMHKRLQTLNPKGLSRPRTQKPLERTAQVCPDKAAAAEAAAQAAPAQSFGASVFKKP